MSSILDELLSYIQEELQKATRHSELTQDHSLRMFKAGESAGYAITIKKIRELKEK